MDDESTGPLVPEEKELGTVLDRERARQVDDFNDLSDRELIKQIHLTKPIVRLGQEFELQRRFVERLTKAMTSGTIAAWALVAGTVVLGVATILLVIAAW